MEFGGMKKIKNYKSGQVVLVVLLVSAVVMTISMAMTRRTVIQTKINTDEELLKQAFNNAESGLEFYKKTKMTDYVSDGKKLAVVVPNSGKLSSDYVGETLRKNTPEYLWLVEHNTDGTINYKKSYTGTVSVKVENENFYGSIKIDLFYMEGGQYKVKRSGYNFASGKVIGYEDSKIIEVGMIGNPLLLAVTPLFDNTKISFSGTTILPNQGEKIESTGMKDGVKSVVSVARRFVIPSFLLEAIVAEGEVRVEKDD
jgi:hypothetical protein